MSTAYIIQYKVHVLYCIDGMVIACQFTATVFEIYGAARI
jgi:hypothetical protein